MLLQTVIRIPFQESSPRQRNFTVDWIPLSPADLDHLRPPVSPGTYTIPDDLAARILVHFRPALDKGLDPDAEALAIITAARMEAMPLSVGPEQTVIGLSGTMRMDNPTPVLGTGYWLAINAAEVTVIGYLTMDTTTRQIADLKLLIEAASFQPPQGGWVTFQGAAHPYDSGTSP